METFRNELSRIFKGVNNSDNGDTSSETAFHYKPEEKLDYFAARTFSKWTACQNSQLLGFVIE